MSAEEAIRREVRDGIKRLEDAWGKQLEESVRALDRAYELLHDVGEENSRLRRENNSLKRGDHLDWQSA